MDERDPFVRDYDESELRIAAEFLTNWLPFLTRDICPLCSQTLTSRIRFLNPDRSKEEEEKEEEGDVVEEEKVPKMSWADMAAEEEEEEALEMEARDEAEKKAEEKKEKETRVELTRERREMLRFANVQRKKDFLCLERIKGGKLVNILQGLQLHSNVFSAVEQNRIVDVVREMQRRGRNGELGDRTYFEPEKRTKGCTTIQLGCCYNYAVDKEKNPAGILRHVVADPLPPLFKVMIKRLVRWHVLPPSCIPNSCIVNIYEPGDYIPPHIDSHDFVRPFCTVSFLSECDMIFGYNIRIISPGEFTGAATIPLPVGSVLVVNGNSADVAKHCIPSVATERITITFRKMDEKLHPNNFKPDPNLLNIEPLPYNPNRISKDAAYHRKHSVEARAIERVKDSVDNRHPSSSHHEGCDAAEFEGSSRRAGRNVPVSDSPGILPLPSSCPDAVKKQRKLDMPVHREMKNEHTPRRSSSEKSKLQNEVPFHREMQNEPIPHRSTPDRLKPQNESIMRIICMENKRIVVKSNPDNQEGSSCSGSHKEHSDVSSSRSRSINSGRRVS